MRGVRILEGASGIIKIYDNGLVMETINPSYDLDSAKVLLDEYYADKKNNGVFDGFDWIHSTVSLMYWNLFYNYIKYQHIIEKIHNKKIARISKGNLKRLMYITNQLGCYIYLLEYTKEILKFIITILINIRNIIVVNTNNKVIFINGRLNDFRGSQIIDELKNNYDVMEMARLSIFQMIRNFFNRNIIFRPYPYSLRFSYLKSTKCNIMHSANEYFSDIIKNNIRVFKGACRLLKGARGIFCFDDCNENYPYIHASKLLNKKIYAFQHGLYTSRHVAYTMDNFISVTWYDYLIVYSKFWREVFLKNNNIYPSDNIIIGANKHFYNYGLDIKLDNKNILIIYEYLSDNVNVGKYISELISLKWNVMVKLRPDDDIDIQIETYQLSTDIRNSVLWFQNDLSSYIVKTDAILGVYSTMLFDLLPYQIPTFRMNNDFKLCDDESFINYIGKLDLEDLPNLANIIEKSRCYNLNHPTGVERFFSSNKLIDIVNI